MKRYKNLVEKLILLSAFLLLLSCATTQQAHRVKSGETINMGSYTVNVPPGDDWEIHMEKQKDLIAFLKLKKPLGRVVGSTLIKVFRNEIAPPGWHLSEEEAANDFRNNEEKIMREEGVKKGLYELTDVQKNIETVEDKKLYTMSYKIKKGTFWGEFTRADSWRAQEAMLYLYFPPDFREKHVFYGFLLSEDHAPGYVKVDLAPIHSVINSFQITSPPADFPAGMNGEMLRAAIESNISKIKDLINKGADVNAKSTNGWTPLMFISAIGNKEIANLLIDKGADINEKNHQGQTPLFFAAHWGQAELVNLLIKKGANINAQMDDGWSVLTDAIDMNRVDIAKILIAKGADVNLRSKNGWTALMAASLKNHPDIAKLLIEKGADVNAKAEKDATALKIAKSMGNVEIVRLLKERGAKE